ncbi:MAG: MarR family winged helix-turn-helix transcriptional regulator [Clostridia bacterium]
MADCRVLAERLINLQMLMRRVPVTRRLTDLDRGTFLALNDLLARDEPVHPKELSRRMAISSARVAALLNHMEREGMIVRTADPTDNRKVLVSLTEAGRQQIQSRKQEAVEIITQTLEALDPGEAEAYLRIQAKILNHLMHQEKGGMCIRGA